MTAPTVEIFDGFEQGSDEWREIRKGIPTASRFATVRAAGVAGAPESKTRYEYLKMLAGEIVSGETREEDFKSAAMERGTVQEPELRSLYAMLADVEPRQVAFVKRTYPWGSIGCSPDSLVDDAGMVEIKSMKPERLIDVMKSERIPAEFLPQVHGNLLVTGRAWCDVAIGYRGMPMFRRRVMRDSAYCTRLEVALETFQQELDEMVAWLRNYGRE